MWITSSLLDEPNRALNMTIVYSSFSNLLHFIRFRLYISYSMSSCVLFHNPCFIPHSVISLLSLSIALYTPIQVLEMRMGELMTHPFFWNSTFSSQLSWSNISLNMRLTLISLFLILFYISYASIEGEMEIDNSGASVKDEVDVFSDITCFIQ